MILLLDGHQFQIRKPLQAQIQDGLGLDLGKAVFRHQLFLGFLGGLAAPDELDDRIHVVHRHHEALQDVLPAAGRLQLALCTPGDHIPLMADEVFEDALKVQLLGLALGDGGHVHAEGALEIRILEQSLEDLLRVRVLLHLDDRPHALPVRFVPDVGDAGEHGLLLLGHGQNLLQGRRLVDAVGDLGDDDEGLPVLQLFEVGLGPHGQLPPARFIGRGQLRRVDEVAPRGEVRPGHDLHELFEAHPGIVDHGYRRVDGLPRVMGRDVGGEAHGDARGPVDEQVGEPTG